MGGSEKRALQKSSWYTFALVWSTFERDPGGNTIAVFLSIRERSWRLFMSEFEPDITTVNIEDELKQSYLDYAMSVIVGRALPDVRDERTQQCL